jgi:peptide/nickel transport system permease protein
MTVFLLKRLLIGLLTLVVASMVVFAVMEVLPGDPARLMLGMNATAEAVAALRTQMGLDDPVHLRYLNWVGACWSAISAAPSPIPRRSSA